MAEQKEEVDEEELVEYEEEENEQENGKQEEEGAQETDHGRGFVAVHATGFRDFLLKPELLAAIRDCAFEHPSEVQHQCIPQAILGMDVICQAKSGMGKTAVFVLTTLQQLDAEASGDVTVLCLCHTRELAYQIEAEYERFTKHMPSVKCEVFYGGIPKSQNIKTLETPPHIVVGTPGRILDLLGSKHLKLDKVKHFVLDECDEMLKQIDMRRDVQEIFKATPRDKQTMMFSATLSTDIRGVCKKFMQDPMEIYVDNESKLTLHGLQQYYVQLEEKEKNRKLNDLLDALEFNQVVIFVKNVRRCKELDKLLIECNFPSICIYGGRDMPQEERIRRYKAFKAGDKRIMVATDLFGRGIDIEKVNIVINYDMPESSDQYLHRVGRAGRFGTRGLSISFATKEDYNILEETQSRFEVKVDELPNEIDVSTYMTVQ